MCHLLLIPLLFPSPLSPSYPPPPSVPWLVERRRHHHPRTAPILPTYIKSAHARVVDMNWPRVSIDTCPMTQPPPDWLVLLLPPPPPLACLIAAQISPVEAHLHGVARKLQLLIAQACTHALAGRLIWCVHTGRRTCTNTSEHIYTHLCAHKGKELKMGFGGRRRGVWGHRLIEGKEKDPEIGQTQ